MKMTLRIVAQDIDSIRNALKELSEDTLHGSCCGSVANADFDYDFVDSNDLFSDDSNKPVIRLHDFPKAKEQP